MKLLPRSLLVLAALALNATPRLLANTDQAIDAGPGVRLRNVAEPFSYFVNDWTVIGLKDYPDGTRISPTGELLLADGLICRPLIGQTLTPLDRRLSKTLRDGYLPIVQWRFVLNDAIEYTLEMLACPSAGGVADDFDWPREDAFLNLLRVRITNLTDQPTAAHFGLGWQPRSGSLACEITKPANGIAHVTGGDMLLSVLRFAEQADIAADGSQVHIKLALGAKQSAELTARIPFRPLKNPVAEQVTALEQTGFDAWAQRAADSWNALLGRGLQLNVPENKVLNTYKASLVYQFIGRDKGELHAGEGFYDELYLRDGAYQAISLAHAGYLKEARQSLEPFLRHQHENGQFWTQEGQLDANGYALWALVEYYRLSGDRQWLARVYPVIRKAVGWVRQAREQNQDSTSPFQGLLPAAPADGEFLWDGRHHIVGYDFQNLRGVQAAALAAEALGETADAADYRAEFEDYKRSILRAVERTGLPYYPPSYEKAGTHWGNLEALFPTPLIGPDDARLTATVRHVHTEFGALEGQPGGFIEGTLPFSPGVHKPAAIHPYLTQFVTNTHIIRGESAEALDGFYSYLLHTTATHGFPEGVHYRLRQAWGDTVPHLWAAALYVTTLRNMLVREEQGTLHLLSCVPAPWLADGRQLEARQMPTHFGPVSVVARGEGEAIRVEMDVPRRQAPERIVVHVPPTLEIVSAALDGQERPSAGHAIEWPADAAHARHVLVLRVRRTAGADGPSYEQKVAEYRAAHAPRLVPIAGLVAPTELGAVDPGTCLGLDLRALANTDPLNAPFNVPEPGEYRFRDLPLGEQVVCGVPFHILSPADNGGRALVVLNGAGACAGFPREVRIPVGARGRFLCILGNVTGWEADDPGRGEHGAVGEYVMHYEDGTTETVPLISGRTVDDWAQPPLATDVVVGLRGVPWHLNLLVLRLADKPVAAVVFRDLGTPASPVLAAMTLVR